MAVDGAGLNDGIMLAGVDLSAKQFFCVKHGSTDNTVTIGAASTDTLIGILQNKPTLGLAADVRFMGRSKALIAATVTVGQRLTSDASGKLIVATGTAHTIATAIEGGATGAIISVLVTDRGTVG